MKWKDIGESIRLARLSRELTQADLAMLAGVSRGRIVEIEAGRTNAKMSTLGKILDALGLTLVAAHGIANPPNRSRPPADIDPDGSAAYEYFMENYGASEWDIETNTTGYR